MRRFPHTISKSLCLLLFAVFLATSVCAAQLKMKNYGEVVVDNLQIGTTYSMVELVNLPLEITNGDTNPGTFDIEILLPAKAELKPGYEAIPEKTWVSITPNQVTIDANGTYKTDVKLIIPNDAKYLGKKFQADIRISSVNKNKSMMAIALGVRGRILFGLAAEKRAAVEQPKLNMDFSVTPSTLRIKDIAVGKKVELMTEDKKPITLTNSSKNKTVFILQSLNPKDTTLPKEPDYEQTPSANMLTVDKEEITLGAGDKQNFKLFVEIPDKPEYKDKKFQFLLSVSTGNATSGARFVQVLVTTKK